MCLSLNLQLSFLPISYKHIHGKLLVVNLLPNEHSEDDSQEESQEDMFFRN